MIRGSRVLSTRPKLPDCLVSRMPSKLVWLKILKASARNCRLVCSRIFVFLKREISHRCNPEPRTEPRGAFPGGPAATGRFTNAAVLNHLAKVCGAPLLGLLT